METSIFHSTSETPVSSIASSDSSFIVIDEDELPVDPYTNDTITKSTLLKDIKTFAKEFANDPNHGYLLLSVTIFIIWAVYIILYNSRVQGQILTAILRHFTKRDISIGSFSISPLWGKLMFRDIIYVNEDFNIRIVNAVLQFHYWLPYLKKEINEDMSKCDPRLWVELNGPELHIYNRSATYSRLEEIFGLDRQIIPNTKGEKGDALTRLSEPIDLDFWSSWRDLIPVIKVDLNMARFIFGNRLVPSTLLLTMEKAEVIYSTKTASSSADLFMHVVRSKAENFKVILAPSPKYTQHYDEPPRYMGEGFVVLSSNKIQFYYYMDEPGVVAASPENVLLDCTDDISPPPVWGLDIKCEKGTDLSYGPWADRQREQLFKFFFPQDYQKLQVYKPKQPGERRQAHQFDVKLSVLSEATIDILFSKEKQTKAVHVTVQKGSYYEMTLPYVYKNNGYSIEINGQLLYLDSSTSLEYRNFLEAESLNYKLNICYPLIWNRHQNWNIEFHGSKVSYHFLYTHKEFFQDLIEDWSPKTQPDIFNFVPYTWKFTIVVRQFEFLTLANEYNWVDCSSQHQANSHIAFCGDALDLGFSLPFVDFLPDTISLKFNIMASRVYLSLYLPPSNTTKNIIAALDRNAKMEGDHCKQIFSRENWRKFCKLNCGWIDCWFVPELRVAVGFIYHPSPTLGPSPQANVSTPEKEEILLSPIRAPKYRKSNSVKISTPENFDPLSLVPDSISVDLRIFNASEIKLYGSILRLFIHLKENIFGEEQSFTDMSESSPYDLTSNEVSSLRSKKLDDKDTVFDERKYRPFEVTVHVDIRNVRGHLMKDCSDAEPVCPTLSLDRVVFEMNKHHQETQMQVLLSPIILKTSDTTIRHSQHHHLQEGFLLLSGFQMRGQAMFSDEGRSPWEETLEYAWLVELTVGSLSGRLTAPQLQHVITGLETFLVTAFDSENCLRHPRPYHLCYHGDPQPDCSHTLPDHYCPTLDVIKYKMIRASLDAIDFHLVEEGADLNLQAYPIRITTCNLHGQHTRSGITAFVQNIKLRNFVCAVGASIRGSRDSNGTGRGEAESLGGLSGLGGPMFGDTWIESGAVLLGPVYVDAAVSSNILHHDMQLIQHKVLKIHDQRTKRLWFFWPKDINVSTEVYGKCGCVGGCTFFGKNKNGRTFFKPSKLDFSEGTNIAILRLNDIDDSPGYGQSILHRNKCLFDLSTYIGLTQCYYELKAYGEREKVELSSGYVKCASPIIEKNQHSSVANGQHHRLEIAPDGGHLQPRITNGVDLNNAISDPLRKDLASCRVGESLSLGRPPKDIGVPRQAEVILGPSSLSDLRQTEGNRKMPLSLSLQTDLPIQSKKLSSTNNKPENSHASEPRSENMADLFQRTLSLTSETYSFYSADEDQIYKTATSLSPSSSQVSLPVVPEDEDLQIRPSSDVYSSSSTTYASYSSEFYDPDKTIKATATNGSLDSMSSHEESSSSSTISNSSSSSRIEDYRKGSLGHSRTSLLHSSYSDISETGELLERFKQKRGIFQKEKHVERMARTGSVSSISFLSAMSSQEDINMVDLHMQLSKPITESPLLMSSYISHMTQLQCHNWETTLPAFEKERKPGSNNRKFVPTFEKTSEGFTAIRMVGESKPIMQVKSPLLYSSNTPSHPYSWDTPVFTWGENGDNLDEFEDIVCGLVDTNTTRTTVVIKLMKDLEIAVSPVALESSERFLEALRPVMETIHPMTIVNRANFVSVRSVEGKNTLKKDRYMYWSRLRDGKKSGTPEQGPVVTSTYQESCFLQVQGQITVPRINVVVLQASVVEELISFSALDNIRDLTCVSLFSFCLAGVSLQFYSGHQSKKSVQIFMRNPRVSSKPKKSKIKAKESLDLLTEPVYIETSEKQQEEIMISVSVNNLHVQLRRLNNESSLLKDASITAIPQHRSKVLFSFCRCNRNDFDNENSLKADSSPDSHKKCQSDRLEEDKMGFIMFEAGLENVALKAVKRKGYSGVADDLSKGQTSSVPGITRRDSGLPHNTFTGSYDGVGNKATRTVSAPTRNRNSAGTVEVSHTAPAAVSTPFYQRRSAPVGEFSGEHRSVSPSQASSGHSGGALTSSTKNSIKEDSQMPEKNPKRDITSFVIELKTVWFNFAAPPRTPITKKIDYTRLDWNLLSTTSPSINAWMSPGDRLTVAALRFLHSSESRRLGIMTSLMAEALDIHSIHVPPKNKLSKLMPLSQTLQEDPSCQLCSVLRSYILQSSLKSIETNLKSEHLPKLATLRQGVVVLTRQWKNVLYMPLLMEQTFKYKQAHPAFSYRSASQNQGFSAPAHKISMMSNRFAEEKSSLLQHSRDSPLSNIQEDCEKKDDGLANDDDPLENVGSSISSNLPPRKPLPSYPPRSSTASAIVPPSRTPDMSPNTSRLSKIGHVFEGTRNLFRGSATHSGSQLTSNRPSIDEEIRPKDSQNAVSVVLESVADEEDASMLPNEDLYRWMTREQDLPAGRHTVTFNKGLDLPNEEQMEGDTTEVSDFENISPPKMMQQTFQEPQQGHFLEAHVIFEPLLSAVGVITQQVTGSALEQLGANVSVTGNVDTLRVDIIESEGSKQQERKKRRSGVNPGNCNPSFSESTESECDGRIYLDIGSEIPAFLCEKVGLEIDVSKVADESRGWVCQQPTLFVSRSALKQHTSTVIHFSLNVNYIAQQVNMPLLRLLHQIASMYQNAKNTRKVLKEQRSNKMAAVGALRTHAKGSYSDVNEYKGVDYSLSLSEEQATFSSLGGSTFRAQGTGSPVSSLSARISPHADSQVVTTNRARPQSFAQRLRSSTKIGKGYMNLKLEKEKEAHSPLLSINGSALETGTISSEKSLQGIPGGGATSPLAATPKCWRNIYYLVDLYATTPETKTVQQRSIIGSEFSERLKSSQKLDQFTDSKDFDAEKGVHTDYNAQETSILTEKLKDSAYLNSERTPVVIFGLAKIKSTKLLATLSGLKLEAEMNNLHSSVTYREKVRGTRSSKTTSEMSLTGHIGSTMILLLEGIAPNQQTVVKVTVSKSQGLYSSFSRKSKDKNSALITIGPIQIDIPQHPIILHDMMTRGTKQLSTTLQELRVTRPSRLSRGTTIDEADAVPSPRPQQKNPDVFEVSAQTESILHPLAIQFSILLQELSINAALLPSLQASYCMQQVSSLGVTGAKAKFTVRLPSHHLAFSTRLQDLPNESTLPPSAKIALPQVHIEAEYLQDDPANTDNSTDGMVLRKGGFLNAVAEIGALKHSLTTDLLNHLVFVQKVFMKEVNEVVQKMAGSDKPVPLWSEDGSNGLLIRSQRLLFNVHIKLEGIIITATTPTQSAVRLETDAFELQLSNRVQNIGQSMPANVQADPKIFGKAQVKIALSLGSLIHNEVFDEAEPEMQQLAYFRTSICLRNAFHNELASVGDEAEVVLITLTRPIICIQPLAVDRAVLVWLNYKNAYEYWNEQRTTLNKEVLKATQQVFEKVPQFSSTAHRSNLFLQLTVSDIGICLPLNPCRTISRYVDSTETRDALVVTLESTIISACNSNSLVCKAHFTGFCLRFAPEFETSLDEWKPDFEDPAIMNWCRVSKGTYDVCSRTVAQNAEENAKWLLNVKWEMEGVVLHLDVNIGKYLNALARTLTMLTSPPDAIHFPSTECDSDEIDHGDHTPQDPPSLPSFIFDPNLDARQRTKLLEIEMNEQAKTVNDLKTLGASVATIEQEMRRLKELEKIVSNDFRRDMLMKIRRQSIKATSMKDRLGLGNKLQLRSKSFKVPSPTIEVKEPLARHASVASTSTDSNLMDEDPCDVFISPADPSPTKPSRSRLESTYSDYVTPSLSRSELKDGPPFKSIHQFAPEPATGSSAFLKPQDPGIDLELDVRVSIKCGECVLFNRSIKDEEARWKIRKDRSFSGGIYDLTTSPVSGRKKSDFRQPSSGKFKHISQSNVASSADNTEFSIPGLDVKVYYESQNLQEETPGGSKPFGDLLRPLTKSRRSDVRDKSPMRPAPKYPLVSRMGTKSGEAVLRRPTSFSSTKPVPGGLKVSGVKRASLFTWMTLQSIPEETMISPSILDFMEKVLEPIPLTEFSPSDIDSPETIVEESIFNNEADNSISMFGGTYSYASFPVDVIVYFHMQPSTIRFSCQPVSRVECLLKLPSLNVVFSSKRVEECEGIGGENERLPAAMGGLSVTGALEDFSLFVFHPYGGKQRGSSGTPGIKMDEGDRKDSLSVVVEFVKFHISRSRKINFKQENFPKNIKPLGGGNSPKAVIRFSTVVDIGKALFKYDMRRLAEILIFPKAWYRRTIVRRLFLGDFTSRSANEEPKESPHTHKKSSTTSLDESAPRREAAHSPVAGKAESLMERTKKDKPKVEFQDPIEEPDGGRRAPEKVSSWETLVQFAVNFTELNVHMNMGNVMGNVIWTTKGFNSEGRLSIGSSGHKNVYIGLGLGSSSLEAKGGIVGGSIELAEINVYFKIREDSLMEPDHVIGVKLFAAQSRLDYMGTSVLMGRVSSLRVTMKDEWKLKQCASDDDDTTRRGATIFILGDLEWDQLQLLISKSTTADLLKMHHKLEEFFTQQFKSSKRVFSSLQTKPRSSIKLKDRQREANKKISNASGHNTGADPRHHRHWQKVLDRVSGLRLTTLPLSLPEVGTVLGGSIELHGNSIFLALFHGLNFRSKSWALFSLKEPYINFTSEVQEISKEAIRDTHIAENLTVSLGPMEKTHAQHVSMAKVSRITRNTVFPPQFKTIQEWFYYAFYTSDLDDVDRFPALDSSRTDSLNSTSSTENKRSPRGQEHNHSTETIFAFPSMETHLSTKHLQSFLPPDIMDEKPIVECSLVAEFQDHIFVTVDAENFFFLHDLITSYIKDTKAKMPAEAEDKSEKKLKTLKVNEPTQFLQQDWREFTCLTWHLEPTVRLLSWATRNLDPYGVDYILNKLGFSHASTTIPKWLQRGCMDPLDKLLSLFMHRMIATIHEHDSANR